MRAGAVAATVAESRPRRGVSQQVGKDGSGKGAGLRAEVRTLGDSTTRTFAVWANVSLLVARSGGNRSIRAQGDNDEDDEPPVALLRSLIRERYGRQAA